ncbi:hypothetical protein [Cytobacillus dafuensis]|uniref:Uncharacterized protein n=1 Tax=Cytobacillus dafuensis TaxID=1742359 RepID=A0A5B8Z0U5_CYTDA|nr:hypothetical protein [Cytobacillus dafuensis]QED46528.1 hypothetical protein FSZ17_04145 [Cytobacillus dafuensis]
MEESRLEKMEDMLATLITMVGNMNNRLENLITEQSKTNEKLYYMEKSFSKKFDKIDERFDQTDERNDKLQADQKSMRREIMEKLIVIQADQDHTWEKTVRNEREIAKLKIHLQS